MWASAGREFLAGLRSTNPRVFLASLLVAAAVLACLELALAKGSLWRLDSEWLISTPYDDWTHAAWAVNQLDEASDATPIYLIGGSGSREAVVSNESVERALASKRPGNYRFLNLGTRNQTFFESVLLIDNLPDTSSGLIVFGITPHFFTDGIDDAHLAVFGTRFPLHSDTLVEALKVMGVLEREPLALNLLRYRAMIANYINQRIAGGNLFERLPYRNHLYEGHPPLRGAQLFNKFRQIAASMSDFSKFAPLNSYILEVAVRLAQAKGYKVLLVELPRNPIGETPLYGNLLDPYRKSLQVLAEATGAEHLDLHADYAFPPSYFYDHLHQIDEARRIFQERFVNLLVEQLGTQ